MKTRRLNKGAVLVCGLVLVGIVTLVFWSKFRAHLNPSPADTRVPAERLRGFSLTNAPKTAVSGSWSTNRPADPLKAFVTQQVAAPFRARRANGAPATTATMAAGFRDAKQAEALRRLQERVGPSLQVYLRPENNTPNQLKGSLLARADGSGSDQDSRNETTAKTFLHDNAALFLIDTPDSELQLANRQADDLGDSVLRFTQRYRGLAVWPAEIGVHLDAAGNVDWVDRNGPQNLDHGLS